MSVEQTSEGENDDDDAEGNEFLKATKGKWSFWQTDKLLMFFKHK